MTSKMGVISCVKKCIIEMDKHNVVAPTLRFLISKIGLFYKVSPEASTDKYTLLLFPSHFLNARITITIHPS